MEYHLTATECHLPYGITLCYLPPDTSERKWKEQRAEISYNYFEFCEAIQKLKLIIEF